MGRSEGESTPVPLFTIVPFCHPASKFLHTRSEPLMGTFVGSSQADFLVPILPLVVPGA